MTEEMKLLIELQEIDSAMIKKTEVIDGIPGKISSVEQPLKDAQAAYEKLKHNLDASMKKKKEKETLLDDVGEKVKKLKSRTTEIKTNKEYQALLKEIESAEKERSAVEDEILLLMETVDSASREVKAQEAKVKAEEEKRETFRRKLEAEVAEGEKDLGELRSRRDGIVKSIDGELYKLYFKLLESKRGLAVVEVKDEICRGCNMNIPPQLFVEIKKTESMFQCPQCGRILYWKG